MAQKKRLTASQRRAQLIEVGRHVLAEHGYEATSVEELARAAGVSKPIIYEHFGGKEGLFAVIVDREMDILLQAMTASIARGTARERFEGAVLAFLRYIEERPSGFAVLTRDAPTTNRGNGMHSVIADLAERIRDVFEREFAKLDRDLDPRISPIYAHALIGMVTLTGQYWMDNQELPAEEVAGHLAALGWMGLRHLPTEPPPL